jgi:hypothetical protein
MYKFLKFLLALAHVAAQREAANQAAKQVKFKKRSAAKAIRLREKQRVAERKAQQLAGAASLANAQAALGCNKINEAERLATSLRHSLDHVVGQ